MDFAYGEEFPEKDKEFFTKNFQLFDKDNSGHIALADVGPALQMCGIAPSKAQIEEISKLADRDGSGVVSNATFLNCVFYAFKTYKTLEDLKDAFRTFDGDGRGVLTQSELRYILTTLGEPLTQEEMNGFLAECQFESDPDGNVLYEGVAGRFMPAFLQAL
uniref:EF-hand domain-containing protein n=1 Tax=Neobodo designis TaxID=312471 RepID=A0A7S1PSS8_NEODS|mmetsp:Transcript_20153/g.62603  ORF Transcript_20153/g.62603 Transcript_20153/m.62603 type:complete len:161 (+) Transcript_20153:110-592(+)